MWYDGSMKKEAIRELGKFILDITKIIVAIAVITPFVKGGGIEIVPIIASVVMAGIGIYIINKGAKDE